MEFEKVKKRFIPMSETMFYILLSLRVQRHGYGIMQHVREITNDKITLGAGTIYQSLSKLQGDKLICALDDIDRKKMYVITDLGKQILAEEAKRIALLYKNSEELR